MKCFVYVCVSSHAWLMPSEPEEGTRCLETGVMGVMNIIWLLGIELGLHQEQQMFLHSLLVKGG